MAFNDVEIARYAGLIEKLIWTKRRPPLRLRDTVREGQRIEGYEIELFLMRPLFSDPTRQIEESIAKAHYYGYYPYGYYPYGYYPYGYDPYGYGYDPYDQPGYEGVATGRGSSVAGIQLRLARTGNYHGRIDGVMGPRTRYAIRAYERSHNLRVTER
jgi:hypothetical protein